MNDLFEQPKKIYEPPKRVFEAWPIKIKQDKDLRRACEEWISRNPKIYDLYIRFAREMASTSQRMSISMLTERVRYETYIENWEEPFKISNSFRAYIARKIVEDYPEWENRFGFRPTRS